MMKPAPWGAGSDTDQYRVWRQNLWQDGDANSTRCQLHFLPPIILDIRVLSVAFSIERGGING